MTLTERGGISLGLASSPGIHKLAAPFRQEVMRVTRYAKDTAAHTVALRKCMCDCECVCVCLCVFACATEVAISHITLPISIKDVWTNTSQSIQ